MFTLKCNTKTITPEGFQLNLTASIEFKSEIVINKRIEHNLVLRSQLKYYSTISNVVSIGY